MMIAALAGGSPAKNGRRPRAVAISERATRVRVMRARGDPQLHRAASQSARGAAVPDGDGQQQADRRDPRQRNGECVYRIPEKLPIIMFCGFPVIVAVEPTSMPWRPPADRHRVALKAERSTLATRGARTRQIASFTRKAENAPDPARWLRAAAADRACAGSTQAFTNARKPEMRGLATMIVVPSSRVIVPMSTAL